MEAKKVVVKGGGSNLFRVSYYDGTFYVYKVETKIPSNTKHEIVSTGSYEDALSIIRSYSGKEIDHISTW